jgi:hypothetical protein
LGRKDNCFDWKDGVSLKEYLCQRLSDLEEKIELNFKLNGVALDKAEIKMEARLALMNEVREQLKDQATKFASRTEVQIQLDRMEADIKSLRESRAELQGKASQASVIIGYLMALAGIAMGLIAMFTK